MAPVRSVGARANTDASKARIANVCRLRPRRRILPENIRRHLLLLMSLGLPIMPISFTLSLICVAEASHAERPRDLQSLRARAPR